MNLEKFDPFNNRQARDIRNTLSKSFLESLVEKDVSVFQKRAAGYLQQDLEQVYQMYVKKRLLKYDEVFALIEQGKIEEKFHQALILWDQELYFEMHELLEKIWINAAGNERKALQGLIRAAGMKIHAESGNIKASITMGRKAQGDLQLYKGALKQPGHLDSILIEITETLSKMDSTSQAQ